MSRQDRRLGMRIARPSHVGDGNLVQSTSATSATKPDLIVVGAGIAGLYAARRLARAGARVTVLEGRAQPGGRILTERPSQSATPVELGAEFVHGRSPELRQLIDAAGLELERVEGEHYELDAGEVRPAKVLAEVLDTLARPGAGVAGTALDLAKERHFGAERTRWLSHFVEGFHAAPPDRVSARSIVRQAASTEAQARCRQGYGALIDFLCAELVNAGASLGFGSRVQSVAVEPHGVVVRDQWSERRAGACIVALPLPMHQAPRELGGVELEPAPEAVTVASRRLESGLALRVTLRLGEPAEFQRALPHGSFMHVLDEDFPTWWSGADGHEPRLVAWCGGPRCARLAGERRASAAALEVLGRITRKTVPELRGLVREIHVHDFGVDRFSRGSYPYELAEETDGELPLVAGRAPLLVVGDFFDADEVGTVSAAVKSGHAAAAVLLGEALPVSQ
jgi:glycine/D-amino acid oxidase-like deaminating enzyme